MSPIFTLHKCILSIACALLSFCINAQTPAIPITFGSIDLKDLQMKTYEKDTSAEAVVLCDYGEYSYYFGNDLPKVHYKRHIRIKILKKAGFGFASQKIPFYISSDGNKSEDVSKLKAITWNLENGSLVSYTMSEEDFFEEKGSGNTYYKKFTFPQVREGSVLEFSYELESGFWYDLRSWNFQTNIPTVWSELRAEIPAYFDFKITLLSFIPLNVKETKQDSRNFIRSNIRDPYFSYRFALADAPSLKIEPYVTTIENYRSKISFELASTFFPNQGKIDYSQTWETLNETLLTNDNFGKQIKKYDEAQKIAEILKSQTKDSLSLLTAAYQYIQNSMQWDGDNRVFTSGTNLNKVAEKKIGNSAEINLMLVRLLRECGFEANPVILSTRENGFPTDLVLLDRFDFTIAHVVLNGKDLLLDATSKLTKVGQLPLRCLNDKGRLIVRKNSRWIPIPAPQTSRKVVLMEMDILPDQQLKGNVDISYLGHDAIYFKSAVLAKGKEAYLVDYKKNKPNYDFSKIAITGVDSAETMPLLKLTATVNEAYSIAGDRIYLSPMIGMGEDTNPFKTPNRSYPVEFGIPQEETFSALYKLPADYAVEELPKSESVALPNNGGRFDFRTTVLEGGFKIDSKIALKKPIYSSEEYGALREFYNRIVFKHAEKIILKKK